MSSQTESRIAIFDAGADLTDKQYHGAKFGANDKTVVAAAAQEGFGIIMSSSLDTGLTEVALTGAGAKVKLAGEVTRGESLTTDADGAFVAAGDGERCLAIAMASGVSGDVIPVEVELHNTLAGGA